MLLKADLENVESLSGISGVYGACVAEGSDVNRSDNSQNLIAGVHPNSFLVPNTRPFDSIHFPIRLAGSLRVNSFRSGNRIGGIDTQEVIRLFFIFLKPSLISSFLGHALTGFTIGKLSHQKNSWLWVGWLTFLAMSPDLNYLLIWTFGYRPIFALTHSIGFASILPAIIGLILWIKKSPNLRKKVLLMFGAAYSHLVLDLLVGVWPKPIFWPFYGGDVRLPFGILPSAGALSLSNFYFWRNLLIELGILLPVIGLIYVFRYRKRLKWKKAGLLVLILVIIWCPFLVWGVGLSRG